MHFLYHLAESLLVVVAVFGLIGLLVYLDKTGVKTASSGSAKTIIRGTGGQEARPFSKGRRKKNRKRR